jgi:hypothetical protein
MLSIKSIFEGGKFTQKLNVRRVPSDAYVAQSAPQTPDATATNNSSQSGTAKRN